MSTLDTLRKRWMMAELKENYERFINTIKKHIDDGKLVIMKEARSLGSWYLVCTDVMKKEETNEVFFYFRPAKISEVYSEEAIEKMDDFHKGEFKTDEEIEAFGKPKKRKVYFLNDDIRYPYCKAVTRKSCRYCQYKYNHIFIDYKVVDKY